MSLNFIVAGRVYKQIGGDELYVGHEEVKQSRAHGKAMVVLVLRFALFAIGSELPNRETPY